MRIAFCTHSFPFPPTKGEKQRAFNIIRHLANSHEVSVFSLSRNSIAQSDIRALEEVGVSVKTYELSPLSAMFRAGLGIALGRTATESFFYSKQLLEDLESSISEKSLDLIFCYCSSTAYYGLAFDSTPRIIDLVDVDSVKWGEFQKQASLPMSWIYQIEARRLQSFETQITNSFKTVFVTTEHEKRMLSNASKSIEVLTNGIELLETQPVEKRERGVVLFTGQMDYLPNVDAASYFSKEILPKIQKTHSKAKFQIVGRNPSSTLKKLCCNSEIVGEVTSVHPYLARAEVFVAPMRLGQGVQIKVLEAMAAKLPVVASSRVARGLSARAGTDFILANSADDFSKEVTRLLNDELLRQEIGEAGYRYVCEKHDWSKNLGVVDRILETAI